MDEKPCDVLTIEGAVRLSENPRGETNDSAYE